MIDVFIENAARGIINARANKQRTSQAKSQQSLMAFVQEGGRCSPSDSNTPSDADLWTVQLSKAKAFLPPPLQEPSSPTPPFPIPSSFLMSWGDQPIQPSNILELTPRLLMKASWLTQERRVIYKHQAGVISC